MRKYQVSQNANYFSCNWPLTLRFCLCPLPACFQAAVEDLELLRNATPEESNVVFQLAKVYRLLGNVVKSAQTLAAARDISPKSMSKIKKLLETVKDEGEDKMDEG